jgi:hypothetical protein
MSSVVISGQYSSDMVVSIRVSEDVARTIKILAMHSTILVHELIPKFLSNGYCTNVPHAVCALLMYSPMVKGKDAEVETGYRYVDFPRAVLQSP